jgi:putative glutamine amidotransferase
MPSVIRAGRELVPPLRALGSASSFVRHCVRVDPVDPAANRKLTDDACLTVVPSDETGPVKPIIGITTRRQQANGRRLDVVEQAYSDAVVANGGVPRLLPCRGAPDDFDALRGIDGLLLTGGGDVDPQLYGAIRSDETGGVDRERDLWEIGLVGQALQASVPILGICRGCQVLNVAFGGTLLQHLPARTDQPHLVPEREQIVHHVHLEPGTQLAGLEDETDIGVNSIHHQAVATVGATLRVAARSEDGIIEAIEHPQDPLLGVQWHPENLFSEPAHGALFRWLVRQAAGAGLESGDVDSWEDNLPGHGNGSRRHG